MEEVKQIVQEIENGAARPLYFLMGEEPFYIDRIAEYIETSVLSEGERAFNQMVIYGKEASLEDIVSHARRYPMMAEKQVILVKEAQHLSRTIERLLPYAENPQRSTVLVFCYKYKKIDRRKKLYKAILASGGLVFESKVLYENQVAEWIRRQQHGRITPKAAILLVDYLGTDLNRISNELKKLRLVLSEGEEITPESIEEHIGISKDYNNFELKKAIGERNLVKVSRIMNYFAQNPRDNPFVVTITVLHNFFTQLLQYHGLSDHSPKNVAGVLRIHPFFVPEYQAAAKNFPMKRASQVISRLRDMDLKGKGVGAQNISHNDLLKELLICLV